MDIKENENGVSITDSYMPQLETVSLSTVQRMARLAGIQYLAKDLGLFTVLPYLGCVLLFGHPLIFGAVFLALSLPRVKRITHNSEIMTGHMTLQKLSGDATKVFLKDKPSAKWTSIELPKWAVGRKLPTSFKLKYEQDGESKEETIN